MFQPVLGRVIAGKAITAGIVCDDSAESFGFLVPPRVPPLVMEMVPVAYALPAILPFGTSMLPLVSVAFPTMSGFPLRQIE